MSSSNSSPLAEMQSRKRKARKLFSESEEEREEIIASSEEPEKESSSGEDEETSGGEEETGDEEADSGEETEGGEEAEGGEDAEGGNEEGEGVKKKRTRKAGRKAAIKPGAPPEVTPYFKKGYFNSYPLRAYRVAEALRRQLGPYHFATPVLFNSLTANDISIIGYAYSKRLPLPSVAMLPSGVKDGDKILAKHRKDLNTVSRNSVLTLLNLVVNMYVPWISVHLLSTTYTIVRALYHWRTSARRDDGDPKHLAVFKKAWRDILNGKALGMEDLNDIVHR